MSAPMVKHFEANEKGRDFVVGDIHGCTDKLRAILRQAGFNPETDRVFSVGDLADRGPDSEGAFSYLYEPWFHAARGNHEDILLICVEQGGDWNWWRQNGGDWAFEADSDNLKEYAARIHELPYAITVGDGERRFNVIHAEFFGTDADLDAGNFSQHTAMQLLWGRSLIGGQVSPDKQAGLSPTFCGHTILKQPGRLGAQIFIDTGAFLASWGKTGFLTLIEPATGDIWRA